MKLVSLVLLLLFSSQVFATCDINTALPSNLTTPNMIDPVERPSVGEVISSSSWADDTPKVIDRSLGLQRA